MENWKAALSGQIPKGNYTTELLNGEAEGLVLKLRSDQVEIVIHFGYVRAVRMLDEGLVQGQLYGETELAKFKSEEFPLVIYEISDGEFERRIRIVAGDMWATLVNPKHYIVITQNYNIDIITEGEPSVKMKKMLT